MHLKIILPTPTWVKYQIVQDFTPPIISRPVPSFVTFVRFSGKSDTRNKWKMHYAYDTALAAHNTHRSASTRSRSAPLHAPPLVPILQLRITNPTSDQTPVPALDMYRHVRGVTTELGSRFGRQPNTSVIWAWRAAGHPTSSQPSSAPLAETHAPPCAPHCHQPGIFVEVS